jgi:hypothetical protein
MERAVILPLIVSEYKNTSGQRSHYVFLLKEEQ